MPYVPLEKLVRERSSSLYKLVLLAAARANELVQGAQPLIKSESKKVSTIALQEISAGKVYYEENAGKGKKAQG